MTGFLVIGWVRADEPKLNQLSADQTAEGWVLLFDGQTSSKWQIEGGHEIADGMLILGGKNQARAVLKAPFLRGWEIHFQYRLEGNQNAGIGWDSSRWGEQIPGVTLLILTPAENWRDSSLQEYFDVASLQWMIKHQGGANGSVGSMTSFWFEVPGGNKLFLRNIRLKERESVAWQWILLISAVAVGVLFLVVRRWKGKRRQRLTGPQPFKAELIP